jgi:hypothetical protein
MMRSLARAMIGGALLVAAFGGSTAPGALPAVPAAAIGPHQYFLGTVNGNHTQAVVYVFCPGPIGGERTGPPTANQPLGALLVEQGEARGYTGDAARAIVVTLLDDPSARVRLNEYGVTKTIPTSLALPCQGTGVVRFRSVPLSKGSVADDVEVTYQNLGV